MDLSHDDVIKWKHSPRYWPCVRGIHRSSVNSPHKGQWRGALRFSLICAWINGWVNNCETGDLRHYRAHYDVIVMFVCLHKSIALLTPCAPNSPSTWFIHTEGSTMRKWFSWRSLLMITAVMRSPFLFAYYRHRSWSRYWRTLLFPFNHHIHCMV